MDTRQRAFRMNRASFAHIRCRAGSGIRRLGEIASGLMTIDQMVDVAEEAAAECGDQGVRAVTVNKLWDGVRDHKGNYWIA
jgi:hypothetical protein